MYSVQATPKGGLPHSDIRGSKGARPSPRLFAACHVLHRLLVPRHPLNALLSLTSRKPPCAEPSISAVRGQWSGVRKQDNRQPHTKRRSEAAHRSHITHFVFAAPRPKGRAHVVRPTPAPYPAAAFQNLFTLTMTTASAEHLARPLARCRAIRPTKPNIPEIRAHPRLRQRLAGRGPALVEVDGIEPTTPCLQSRCSPS
jgi:hypothetical protein